MDNKVATKLQNVVDEDASPGQPRWRLAMLLNFLVIAFGSALAGLMLASMKTARKYLEFVDGFDGCDFMMILSVVGFVSVLVGLFGASVTCLSTSLRKYRRIRYLVLAYIGWSAGLVVLAGTSFWLTFTAAGNLDVAFRPGFTASLAKYQKEGNVKTSIDAAQTELQCCGNYNFSEWYTVQWTDGTSKSDVAIPQSCCDTETNAAQSKSCVNQVPFGEASKLTPFQKGCVSAMVSYYGKLLKYGAYLLLAIAFAMGFIVFIVFVEARDPALPQSTEKGNLVQKKVDGSKKEKKNKEKKEDEDSEDEEKPGKAAMPASPPQTMMPYPAMTYPYGYGAAPGMPY